ncbi:peptidoglycan-binding domain-containing protein [Streptomyces boncukensis]|uniref:Peptidoglycan-binding protein n=1 Tax=Streptomyces boncukensis TaxID=2711219 RepID=A0A6G4WYR0_9ACTN|nr:peptidoglycan-binding domain-containing protein [Streptomyces boncukensis]NGO70375.1 peptidoglycan-binding protein [Streptomyces boncukensis]
MAANSAGHDDPLHIRPYVRIAEPPAPEGAAGGSDGAVPDLTPFARQGTDETAELPVVAEARTPRSRAPRSHRGRRRTRRRPAAALAAAGVAVALGAGVLATQLGGDDRSGGRDDRALDGSPTGAPTESGKPDGTAPSADGDARGGDARDGGAGDREPGAAVRSPAPPSAAPSRSAGATAAGTGRASRDDAGHLRREASSAPPSSHRPSRPRATAPGGKRRGGPAGREQRAGRGGGSTLRVGDTGASVTELQRRLKRAGYLSAGTAEDGVYSTAVQEGVFRYQAANGVDGDPQGDYGPHTRRSLESRT